MKHLIIKIENLIVSYFTQNYLNIGEASCYTGISEVFLIKLSEAKVIRSVSNENSFYRKSDLDIWMKEYGVINPMIRRLS